MAQDYYDDCYDDDKYFYSEMDKIEDNFLAIKTNFSGASAMTDSAQRSVEPFMAWGDTVNKVLRFRSAGDDEWFGHMHADDTCKIYVYRGGDTLDGWIVDDASDIQDCVIAVVGDSSDIYNTGGDVTGDWSINAGSHSHKWYDYSSNGPQLVDQDGSWSSLGWHGVANVNSYACFWSSPNVISFSHNFLDDAYTTVYGSYQWRPEAAVGSMQYLDLVS